MGFFQKSEGGSKGNKDLNLILAMLQPVINIALMKLEQRKIDQFFDDFVKVGRENEGTDGLMYTATMAVNEDQDDVIITLFKQNGMLPEVMAEMSVREWASKDKLKKLPDFIKQLVNRKDDE